MRAQSILLASKQASKRSIIVSFFPVKLKYYIYLKSVFCSFYCGRDAPFCVA